MLRRMLNLDKIPVFQALIVLTFAVIQGQGVLDKIRGVDADFQP